MLKTGITVLIILMCVGVLVSAAPGDLDPTFGDNGILRIDMDGDEEVPDIVIQSDGKIIALFYRMCTDPNTDCGASLMRFNPDGGIDTSYGSNGEVNLMPLFANVEDPPTASHFFKIELQSDGKLVTMGAEGVYIYLTRFDTDGNLDTTFGNGGKVRFRFLDVESESYVNNVVVMPDDRIFLTVGAFAIDPETDLGIPPQYVLFMRFLPAGAVDTSFGENGSVIIKPLDMSVYPAEAIYQDNGKIAAIIVNDFEPHLQLLRLNEDGSIDTTFGQDGYFTYLNSGYIKIFPYPRVRLQEQGKLLLAIGEETTFSDEFTTLVRVTADGEIDSTFGSNGSVKFRFAGDDTDVSGTDLVVQQDNKFLLAGGTGDYSSTGWSKLEYGIARFNADGSLDNTFGVDGQVIVDVDKDYVDVMDLELQSDQKVVSVSRFMGDVLLMRFNLNELPSTATPEVTVEPTEITPTATPEVTVEPTETTPTATPEVTVEPTETTPTATPEVTVEPTETTPTATPEVTVEPTEATPTATPEVTPDPTPQPVELLRNRGFENDKRLPVTQPDGWVNAKSTKDRRVCGTMAFNGSCAYRFIGSATERASLMQERKVSALGIGVGDTLTMQVQYMTNAAAPTLRVLVRAFYADTSLDGDGIEALNAVINMPSPGVYMQFIMPPMVLDGDVVRVKVTFQNRAKSGRIFIDDASLSYQAMP